MFQTWHLNCQNWHIALESDVGCVSSNKNKWSIISFVQLQVKFTTWNRKGVCLFHKDLALTLFYVHSHETGHGIWLWINLCFSRPGISRIGIHSFSTFSLLLGGELSELPTNWRVLQYSQADRLPTKRMDSGSGTEKQKKMARLAITYGLRVVQLLRIGPCAFCMVLSISSGTFVWESNADYNITWPLKSVMISPNKHDMIL